MEKSQRSMVVGKLITRKSPAKPDDFRARLAAAESRRARRDAPRAAVGLKPLKHPLAQALLPRGGRREGFGGGVVR